MSIRQVFVADAVGFETKQNSMHCGASALMML